MDGFTQKSLVEKLSKPEDLKKEVDFLIAERDRLMKAVSELPYIEKIYPSDANFFMFKTARHKELQDFVLKNGIILRSRHSMPKCQNCIRVTVGTKEQNDKLIEIMKRFV